MIDATREVRPQIRESTRRAYRAVLLTLVYEIKVDYPWHWRDAADAALDRMAGAGLAAARPPAVSRSTDRKRSKDPVTARGRAAATDYSKIRSAELRELRAVGVRPR